jgi:myosin V
MAETYAKGTRVWFPDKDNGWMSGEVTAVARSGDSLKLTFVDERGKVLLNFPYALEAIPNP